MPYGPHTADDRARMLAALGLDLRRRAVRGHPGRAAGVARSTCPPPEPELELAARLSGLAARNRTDLASFLGAGVYRHWSPPAVDQMLLRGEWYTAYTPYQPEISQGTLQSIYEYESLLAELVDLDVVSRLALRRRGGDRRGRADDLPGDPPRARPHLARRPSALPRRRSRPTSRAASSSTRSRSSPTATAAGTTDLAALERMLADPDRPVAGVIAAQPDFLGLLEPMPRDRPSWPTPPAPCSSRSSSRSAWPSSRRPARTAPTSRPARASRSASRRSTAARTSGILASTDALVRQIPGRLVGMTTDLDGQRAFVMTMRAREQDIRRDKAASNICTNQALLALAASIYLATIGPHGLRDVAALGAAARRRAGGGPGRRRGAAPPSRAVPQRVRRPRPGCRGRPSPAARPRRPGRPRPGRRRAGRPDASPTACWSARPRSPRRARSPGSRRRSPTMLAGAGSRAAARPMSVIGARLQPTIFERGRPGPRRRQDPAPAEGRPRPASRPTPAGSRPPALPEMNEPDVVRHYVNLSQLNYAVDTGLLPARLVHDEVQPEAQRVGGPPARLRRTSTRWPPTRSPRARSQLLWELEGALAEISGMRAVTLQPAAGAQGELTGILMIRAYHRARGDTDRDEVLVPDSRHGTNPATASMAGYRTITDPVGAPTAAWTSTRSGPRSARGRPR